MSNEAYWIFTSSKLALGIVFLLRINLKRFNFKSLYENQYTIYLLWDLALTLLLGLYLLFDNLPLGWNWVSLIFFPISTITSFHFRKRIWVILLYASLFSFMFLMIDNFLDFQSLGFRTICALINFINIIGYYHYCRLYYDDETYEVREHPLTLVAMGSFHYFLWPTLLALAVMITILSKFWRPILKLMLQ